MEKRLILAVVLSFLILYVWAGLSPRPTEPEKFGIESKVIETKEVKSSTSEAIYTEQKEAALPLLPSEATQAVAEEFVGLESNRLKVEFSNKGGTISNITLKNYEAHLPITGILGVNGYDERIFSLDKKDSKMVSYVFEGDNIKITKTYTLSKDDYIVQSETTLENKSTESARTTPDLIAYNIPDFSLDKNAENEAGRDRSLHEYAVSTQDETHRKNNAFKFGEKEKKDFSSPVNWAAFRDRYYALIVKPQYETAGALINPTSEKTMTINIHPAKSSINIGERVTFVSTIYAGPEELGVLKKYELGFEKVKMFYRSRFLDGIGKIIHSLMHTMHKFIPNWGVCIILISAVIYFSMYPLTARGMASMKKMQALQPKIASLKEKYAKNPEKMNKEMMSLYKEHRINPLGGCLPFLFQMPVFIGLYQVLWRDVAFKGADFLWIKDLSQPDALFTLPFTLPFLGDKFNLLPVIMMVIMFAQQKITAKNMNITDPAQMAQQKMMQRIMPVFLGVIFYNFASGLTLYFTMFYLFSTFTQWKMSKDPKVT